jgi:NlpC/P60 family
LKKKSLMSLCASTFCASAAVVSSPLTAFANVSSPSMKQKSIVVNQQTISKPYGFVQDDTTYMPIWYLMQALDKLNIHSTWHNHAWSFTTSRTLDLNGVRSGTGTSSIYVNGHLVQKVNEIVAEDPASGHQTTYMPAWYVMKVLDRLHVNSNWNGTVWQINTESQSANFSIQSNTRPPAQRSVSSDDSNIGEQIANYAKQFIGVPYQWGGESTSGFDCSGLVQTVFAHFHKSLPRTAAEQAQVGHVISKADLQPGDLVFFNTDGSDFSHDGIYVGDGKFISATTSHGVQVKDLNDPYYWGPRFTRATNPGL